MKKQIVITVLAFMVFIFWGGIKTLASSPCSGGIYSDHPALVEECQHQLLVKASGGQGASVQLAGSDSDPYPPPPIDPPNPYPFPEEPTRTPGPKPTFAVPTEPPPPTELP